MDDLTNGRFEAVFGVLLKDEHYEARWGIAEFRDGKFVCLQIGTSHALASDGGLTVAVTLLTGISEATHGRNLFVPGRAVNRVYIEGMLDSETDVGPVFVRTDAL